MTAATTPLRVLVLDDDPADAALVLDELRRAGFAPTGPRIATEAAFLAQLDHDWEVILADSGQPPWDALHALDHLARRELDIPLIVLSGTAGEDAAIRAIRQGAVDYLLKDRLGRLGDAVRRAIDQRAHRRARDASAAAIRRSAIGLAEAQRLAHIGSWEWDLATDTMVWSDELYRIFGDAPSERAPSYAQWLARIDPNDRERVDGAVRRAIACRTSFTLECAIMRADGEFRDLHMNGTVIAERDQAVEVVAAGQDVTELKAAARAQQATEAKYRALIEQIPAVVYADRRDDNQTFFVSPQIEHLLGYTPEEYLADPDLWLRLLHEEDRARILAEVAHSTAHGEPFRAEYRLHARDGRVVWVRDEAVPVDTPGESARIWQGVLLDVSTRKQLEGQLRHQAFHDALTGLPNRSLVLDRLTLACARASRHETKIAVLFLDLDNFKVVNDGLGHAAGDELLIAIGNRLRATVRESDTVARFGGDEFVCVLEELSGPDEATAAAARIGERLAAPIAVAGREIVTTASMGIAVSGIPVEAPETLLRQADQAMYAAKRAGRARTVVFDPLMSARTWSRIELESDLRRATENGQLRLVYQPIVDLASGEIREVEALVRWHHPARGIISPGEFVPVAEETGLIVQLGRWVLEAACREAMGWGGRDDDGPSVAVNLSARQLDHPELLADIADILDRTGHPPARLNLEITERVALSADAATARTLHDLNRLGVRLAIDDFGTGYSGLGSLKRSLVDTLKVDRSFVAGLGRDDRDTAIVRAVVALAAALGLTTIAEGVETAGQASALRDLGCERAQGFLFARPLPPDELSVLLRTHDRRLSAAV